jgi:alanine racemase
MESQHAHKTWIEVNQRQYLENLRFFRSKLESPVNIALVVKSNAYGHGLEQIVGLALQENISHFCVHSIDEAHRVRAIASEAHVLIMGYILDVEIEAAIANDFAVVCFASDFPPKVNKIAAGLGKTARLHLKAETGTNRHGLPLEDVKKMLRSDGTYPNVYFEGIYTHFANIEDTTDHSYAQQQLVKFHEFEQLVCSNDNSCTYTHTACSAAVLLFPQTHYNYVRLGISQYGFWPSRETYLTHLHQIQSKSQYQLKPVLTWKTRIAQIKKVADGDYIGYGCTYKTSRDSVIAVLPVGYFDGYDRQLSNKGYVLINGQRAPIRGRICMNLFMVDVTDIASASVHDEVVLIGNQGAEEITAEQFAGWADTIHYEVIARLNPDIPRVVIR